MWGHTATPSVLRAWCLIKWKGEFTSELCLCLAPISPVRDVALRVTRSCTGSEVAIIKQNEWFSGGATSELVQPSTH
jgi:hypothetical protein